jgi:hypothetical protein
MSLQQRADTTLGTLLALGLGTIAVWDSPYLEFDGGVLLIGAATACLIFWHRAWSWSFLVRIVVMAYFFRCIVFYLTGTDAVKLIAFRDAGFGLVAVGAVYAATQAIRKYAGSTDITADQESVGDRLGTSDSRLAGRSIEDKADKTKNRREVEADVWSPLQFTLRAILLLTLAWSGVLAVGVTAGLHTACIVVFFGLLWFLIAACARLVSSGSHDSQ